MKSHPILEFILLMVIYDVGCQVRPLPVMQCPVGTSIDSAFFFGQTLPNPGTATLKEKQDKEVAVRNRYDAYKGKTRDQMRTALKTWLGISGSVSDEEIISKVSIRMMVDETPNIKDWCRDRTNNLYCQDYETDPQAARLLLESYLDEMFKEDEHDKRWFHMFRGFLKPQDVTMLACGAEAHLPKGGLKLLKILLLLLISFSFFLL